MIVLFVLTAIVMVFALVKYSIMFFALLREKKTEKS